VQIPVVVEPVKGNGFRAWSADPVAVSAKGPTRDEALASLRQKIQKRLKHLELVSLEVESTPHPMMAFAGMFKDDPLFERWQKSIAAYRRQVEDDPNYP
jgi:hypothetical protein